MPFKSVMQMLKKRKKKKEAGDNVLETMAECNLLVFLKIYSDD